jgi:outer membrane receptor for ferrienterochelin and colicins
MFYNGWRFFILISFLLLSARGYCQHAAVSGFVLHEGRGIPDALVTLPELSLTAYTDSNGIYHIHQLPAGKYTLLYKASGYRTQQKVITIRTSDEIVLNVEMEPANSTLKEVVVSGSMREVRRMDSPIPIEVYSKQFFTANRVASLFESFQHINGVRPQVNCNICNTGDIHINGLEGPYTMVLLDGMPIVSGLSTVYGLMGIPQSLIERVEVVKGPASTLYGSEAVGGLINIITKKPSLTPRFSAEVFSSNWQDLNVDIGARIRASKKLHALYGLNIFRYMNPIDNNQDGFTDVTLQQRVSLFNKWQLDRKHQRLFSVAGRLLFENRMGGMMNYNHTLRGSDSIYGESIYTKRWEIFGTYQLPLKERILVQWSMNAHHQDSYYGTMPYIGDQYIGFGQMLWYKGIKNHQLLSGFSLRHTHYDDNTVATQRGDSLQGFQNSPSVVVLPGIFVQDEWTINKQHQMVIGIRYDYNNLHGRVITPRFNYKISSRTQSSIVRFSFGSGYRVANVFTEDHAALSGARKLIFEEALKPERSWNGNINAEQRVVSNGTTEWRIDATAFYTYFTNRIIPDYLSNANQIIYRNLNGHAISQGISINTSISHANKLSLSAGITLMDVSSTTNGIYQRQLLTERFSGVWSLGYRIPKYKLNIDYTGNVYSPMLLPLLGELDNRSAFSPWYSLQNIQVTKKINTGIEIFGGVKNVLNFTPPASSIARPFDPFDKRVEYDAQGQVIATPENPNALTFDPTYMFAPNQGRRVLLGFRYTFK